MDSHSLTGRLVLSLGETLLSGWEAAKLQPDDVVLSNREAGFPHFLLFNNLPVGLGEVIVTGGDLSVLVVDTDFRPSFRVDPGRLDALGQKAPAFIGFGVRELGLDELGLLKPGSIIPLGLDSRAEATLWYAGLALAAGVVVVVGEVMALRITRRLLDLPPAKVLASGNVAELGAARKEFDFSRPDRFTALQIRRLNEIHTLVRRHLEFSLPELPRSPGLIVDQCTLGEARDLLTKAGLGSFDLYQQGRRRAPRDSEGLVFVHPSGAAGGVLEESLRNGWKKFLDFPVAPSLDARDNLSATDMVILVVFHGGNAEQPFMALVYPYATLEPVLNVLGN